MKIGLHQNEEHAIRKDTANKVKGKPHTGRKYFKSHI